MPGSVRDSQGNRGIRDKESSAVNLTLVDKEGFTFLTVCYESRQQRKGIMSKLIKPFLEFIALLTQ